MSDVALNGGEGIDTQFAFALLGLAVLLALWAGVAHLVHRRGRSVSGIYRYAKKIIRERGLARHRPTVEVTPDRGHAVIRWTEDGTERGIILTWHHVLDSEHTSDRMPTHHRTSQQMHESEED